MTEQEMLWFDALTRDRSDSARTLEKPSVRGVQRIVVDKYSDQAYFIYELLQNADDVKATSPLSTRKGRAILHPQWHCPFYGV